MKVSDYKLGDELGKGSFGSVVKAIRNRDNKTVAIKIINIPRGNEKAFLNAQKETEYMERLSDPCNTFVACYENSWFSSEDNKFYIEMEYIEGKNVGVFMKAIRSTNSIQWVYYFLLLIARDVTQGLKFIHEKGIIHGDIKTENILVTEKYVPKIVDFGLSCLAIPDKALGEYCMNNNGTPLYYSPETAKNGIKTFRSDMWSLGIMLYMLATAGGYPLEIPPKTTAGELFKMIVNKPLKPLETINEKLNVLVNNLLNKKLLERWTETRVLEHLEVIEKPAGVAKIPKV